jgi:hypothetical protein
MLLFKKIHTGMANKKLIYTLCIFLPARCGRTFTLCIFFKNVFCKHIHCVYFFSNVFYKHIHCVYFFSNVFCKHIHCVYFFSNVFCKKIHCVYFFPHAAGENSRMSFSPFLRRGTGGEVIPACSKHRFRPVLFRPR